MKPLNAHERSTAFWRFFLFYSLMLTTVIIIVYLGFSIPAMQNKLLKNQMVAYEQQKRYNSSFSTLLASVNDYERTSQASDQNDANIKQAMLGMQTYADNDAIEVKGFYTDILHVLTDVQNNNRQIRIENGKEAYLQALMLQNNKLDKDMADAQKQMPRQRPKAVAAVTQASVVATTVTQEPVKAAETRSIDYNAKFRSMLDSVIRFRQPSLESFNAYLCYGQNTPVVVNSQKGHTFKDLYNEFKKHKKSSLLDVKAETSKNCVIMLTIKWKNNSFLGSNKLF